MVGLEVVAEGFGDVEGEGHCAVDFEDEGGALGECHCCGCGREVGSCKFELRSAQPDWWGVFMVESPSSAGVKTYTRVVAGGLRGF